MAEHEFQDLIIIKRRFSAPSPNSVKGGVWKIAFADFMTAMMCFFLVMWLINAANDDTRQAVASYFNPVRLAELNRKGLADPHLSENTTSQNGEATLGKATTVTAPAGGVVSDANRDALFRDPYSVLSQIAGQADDAGAGSSDSAAGAHSGAAGAGGVAFRDPFDTELRDTPVRSAADVATEAKAPEPKPPVEEASNASGAAATETADKAPDAASDTVLASTPASGAMSAPPRVSGEDFPISSPGGVEPHARVAIPSPGDHAGATAASQAEGRAIEAEIAKAVEGSGANRNPKVAVESTGEGVLISLTDDIDFGMFEIGSAEPQPQTVRIMEKIAEILKARGGSITIRGHTDARPFRGGGYDNWRLSTDRAQIAYYMLVRGGLDESRVSAIEGYADRRLKVPENPDAAENRRIEILLHEDPQ